VAETETHTSATPAETEPDHFMAALPPYQLSEQVSEQVSESLKPRIDELNLWDCVHDLRDHGYTIVKDVAPPGAPRRTISLPRQRLSIPRGEFLPASDR